MRKQEEAPDSGHGGFFFKPLWSIFEGWWCHGVLWWKRPLKKQVFGLPTSITM